MAKSFKVGFGKAREGEYLRRYWDFIRDLEEGDLLKVEGAGRGRLITCIGHLCKPETIIIPPENDLIYRAFSLSQTWPLVSKPQIRVEPDPFNGVLYIGESKSYPITNYSLVGKKSVREPDRIATRILSENFKAHQKRMAGVR